MRSRFTGRSGRGGFGLVVRVGVGLALCVASGLGHAATAASTEPPATTPAAAPGGEVMFDQKFIVELGGGPAGTMRAVQRVEGGRIISTTTTDFTIKRGPMEISISMAGEFVETADHEPISMRSEQKLGAIPIITETRFLGGRDVEVTTTQGTQTSTTRQQLAEGEWLTPARVTDWTKQMVAEFVASGAAGPSTIRTIDPSNGPTIIEITRRDLSHATIEVGGQKVEVIRAVSTNSVTPGISQTEFVDREGMPVRTEAAMGGLPVVMTRADADAVARSRGNRADTPELMVSLFVTPDRPIADARNVTRGKFVLRVTDGDLPDIPTAAGQVFTRTDARSGVLVVDATARTPAPAAEAGDAVFLGSSAMINAEDKRISSMALRALEGFPADQAQRAEALRRFVHAFIDRKSLSVGFASATEVARTRQGDCTEHGVLLAALLRADGIPARVASGLIYADSFAGSENIFGYHMWTQALLPTESGPAWVDLDATLPDATPFDGTHIAVGLAALTDGDTMSSMAGLAPLLGRLKIEVVNIEHAAKVSEPEAGEATGAGAR